MHTFESSNGYHFHHNGDYSGPTYITIDGREDEIIMSTRALIEFSRYVINNLVDYKLDDVEYDVYNPIEKNEI